MDEKNRFEPFNRFVGDIDDGKRYPFGCYKKEDTYSRTEADDKFATKEENELKADKTEVNSLATDKADKAELEALAENVDTKANKDEVNQLATDKADKSETENLQTQINSIITPVTEDAEVQNARIDADGKVFPTLKSRLDAAEGIVKSKAEQADVDSVEDDVANLRNVVKWNGANAIDTRRKDIDFIEGYYFSVYNNNTLVENPERSCVHIKEITGGKYYCYIRDVEVVCFDKSGNSTIVNIENDIAVGEHFVALPPSTVSAWVNFKNVEPHNRFLINSAMLSSYNNNKYSDENLGIGKCSLNVLMKKINEATGESTTDAIRYVSVAKFIPDRSYKISSDSCFFKIISPNAGGMLKDMNGTTAYIYENDANNYAIFSRYADSSFIYSVEDFLKDLKIEEISNEYKGLRWAYIRNSGVSIVNKKVTYKSGHDRILSHGLAEKTFRVSLVNSDDYEMGIIRYNADSMGIIKDSSFISHGSIIVNKGEYYVIQLRKKDGTGFSITNPISDYIAEISVVFLKEIDTKIDIIDNPPITTVAVPLVNGIFATKELSDFHVPLTDENTYSHAGTIIIKDGIAYVSLLESKESHTESGNDVTVNLCYFDINDTSNITDIKLAGAGYFGGITFGGKCACPYIIDNGTTLEYFFCGYDADMDMGFYHSAFDISTKSFGKISKCKCSFDGAEYLDFSANSLNPSLAKIGNGLIDHEIGMTFARKDAVWYGSMCCGNADSEFNALLFETTDFVNFRYVPLPEIRTSDYAEAVPYYWKKHLYIAHRSMYNNQMITLAKYDIGNQKTIVDYAVIRDCGDRPCFFDDGTNIYLTHQFPDRNETSILKINTSHLKNSYPVLSVDSYFNFGMPCMKLIDNDLYAVGTGRTSAYNRVFFTKVTFATKSRKEINNLLYDLLNADKEG